MVGSHNEKLRKVYINLFDWGISNNLYITRTGADRAAEGKDRILMFWSFIPESKWFEYCNNKKINPKLLNKINNVDIEISKKYNISDEDMYKIFLCWHQEFKVSLSELQDDITNKTIKAFVKKFIEDLTTIKKWNKYKKPSMSQEEYIMRKILGYEKRLKYTHKKFESSLDDLKKDIKNKLLEELSNEMLELKRDRCYQSAFDILEKKQKEINK